MSTSAGRKKESSYPGCHPQASESRPKVGGSGLGVYGAPPELSLGLARFLLGFYTRRLPLRPPLLLAPLALLLAAPLGGPGHLHRRAVRVLEVLHDDVVGREVERQQPAVEPVLGERRLMQILDALSSCYEEYRVLNREN